MDKDLFGIFSPVLGEKKDYPTILLANTVNAENSNILTKYGEIWQRKMRTPEMLIGSTVDADSAADQKVLSVTATTNFTVGDIVVINKDGDREEWGVVYSISAAVSITLVDNLIYAHTAAQADKVERKVCTPDGYPIIHYHTFVKRATAVQYLLAFTKAHIYHWNTATLAWDVKWECGSDCTEWDTEDYNDMVIATNNVDRVLYWNAAGDFAPLDTENGIEYGRTYSNETVVDVTSAAGQKVLSVAATTGYSQDDYVIIGRGTDREEIGQVNTVQTGISLTLAANLTYEHTASAVTTVDADSADGQKVLNVASTTGFEVGEFVYINKDGEREEVRKIYTIQAGISLTFTVDLTYTHTQGQGDAVEGTGGDDDAVEEYVSQYLTKAKYVTAFENYLILGYTYENGVSKPQRERWSDLGNAGTGYWLTGDSGSKETEGEEFIKGFGKYQGNLIIFKESSYILQWLVSTRAVWGWKKMPSSIGCQSNHSIVNDPAGRLYFYASDNTIRDIETGEISGDIDPLIKLINPEYAYLVQAKYMAESEDIWWSIPVESNLNNRVVTLNKQGKWGELDLAVPAFGEWKEA